MTKSEVINLRDTLKSGKNYPLYLTVTDHLAIIDESNKFQFTKWDDNNGILYSFRLINPALDTVINNSARSISVASIPYTNITSMTVTSLPIDGFDTFFASLESSGCTMSNDFKELIKHTYKSILHPDRYQLPPTVINNLLGENAVNDKDDYYAGRYVNPTKETLRYAKRNAEIEENSGD